MNATLLSSNAKRLPLIAQGLFITLAIFLSGRLGLAIAYPGTAISLFWLPTGIAVAGLFRWRMALWPAVYLGALLVQTTAWSSAPMASATAIGSTLGPVATAWLLRKLKFRPDFSQSRDVIKLILAAMLGMLIPASGGVTLLWMNAIVPAAAIPSAWASWWMGDTIGVLLAAPFVLTFSRQNLRTIRKQWIEMLSLAAILAVLSWFLFLSSHYRVLAFTTVILVIWAGLRCCISFSSIVVLALSVIAAWGTSLGRGSFEGLSDNLIELWGYMTTLAAVNLMVTALRAISVRTSRELHASEERLRLVNNATFDAIWDWNITTNELWWNEQFPALFGYGLNDLDSDIASWKHRVHPDDCDRVIGSLKASLDSKLAYWSSDYRFLRKDGSYAAIEDQGHIIRDANGKAVRMVGAMRDITKRKEFEETLRISERALQSISQGVLIADANRLIISANNAFTAITGYTEEEIKGKTCRILQGPLTDPHTRAAIRKAQHNATEFSGEILNYRKDGSIFWNELTITPVQDDRGRVTNFIGTIRDITYRKNSERIVKENEIRFRTLCESSPFGIFRTDKAGRCTYTNRRWQEIYGLSLEESLGNGWVRSIHPVDKAKVFDNWQKTTALSKTFSMDFRVQRRDGKVSYIFVQARPVILDDKSQAGYVGSVTDISRRKQTELELLNAKEAAEKANRIKSEFLTTMSHEIRTPMNCIVGMTSLLLESPLTSGQKEMLEATRESGEALMTIINDILDLSKIEAEMLEIVEEEFDLSALIDGMMDLFAHRVVEKKLELAVIIHPDVPTHAVGDSGRLRQILVNLIGNAIKFTAAGEVVLMVDWDGGTMNAASPRLRFQVCDTGVGMSLEQQKLLFRPFTQTDASITRSYGGSGLGLIISKRLVELMGGEIGIKSEPSVGTTLWFTLPNLVAAPVPHAFTRPECALVVESHPATRLGILTSLQSLGVSAEPALDEVDLIKKLQADHVSQKEYDTIILGRDFFDRKTMDALRDYRALNKDKTIRIALTGSKCESLNPDFEPSLVDTFLSKPIKRSSLFALFGERVRTATRVRAEGQPLEHPRSTGTAPFRILLVEDNPMNSRLAVLMLGTLGHVPDIATNGRKAIELFRKQTYDLILMDCHMPEMDGYETTRKMRQIEASRQTNDRVRIIALTAAAMKGERERCFAAGMDEQIIKPLTLHTLKTLIGSLSARPHKPAAQVLEGLRETTQHLVSELGSEAVAELLQSFLTEVPEDVSKIQHLAGGTDQSTLHRLTHSLLGNLALFGLHELRQTAECLDTMAAENQLHNQKPLADKLVGQFEASVRQLRQLLSELSASNGGGSTDG